MWGVILRVLNLVEASLRKGADCVVSIDTTSILVVDRHTCLAIADIGYDSIQEQPWVAGRQKRSCRSFDKGIEAARIEYVVVRRRVLVGGSVLTLVRSIRSYEQPHARN